MRKKTILSLLLLLLGLTVQAQERVVRVHLTNGETLEYSSTDIDSLSFSDPASESPKFTLAYSNLTNTSVTLSVTPADPTVAYYYDLVTASQLAETEGGIAAVVEGYISYLEQTYPTLSRENILEQLLSHGADSDDLTGLPAGTDFVFYAIAVGTDGKCYGEPTTTTFTTLPAGDPADCTFDISYTNLSSEGLTVIVNPSDASVRYWMGLSAVSEYPGDIAITRSVKASIDEYATSNNMTVAQVVKGVTFAGDIAYAESGLTADTDYYIYVYAMDETGASAGSVYKKKFTTTVSDPSDADVSLSYRYFDGDALYELDPTTYASLQGKVYVQTVITPNDEAANWALALASGDLTDETTYPEESTKNAVLQGGTLNATSKNFVADWRTCTFLYFAADAAGVDGVLHRLLVTFDKANARPVTEFSATTTTSDVQNIRRALLSEKRGTVKNIATQNNAMRKTILLPLSSFLFPHTR